MSNETASFGGKPPRSPLDAALWALDAGLWPVAIYPFDSKATKSPGKAPIGNSWGANRPNERSIRASFDRYPKANVGLKLGAEGGVIDFDVDHPDAAGPTLERLFPDGLPETLQWWNASGKFHLAFRHDARLDAIGKTILKGVPKPDGEIVGNPAFLGLEVRIGAPTGEGKQLQSVIPPSLMTNGKARKWARWGELLTLPESVVLDLLKHGPDPKPHPIAPRAPAAARAPAGEEGLSPEQRARLYAASAASRTPAIEHQGGSNETLKLAVAVGPGFDLDPETAYRILADCYNPACQPPWSEKDLRRKVAEAFRVETRRGWLLGTPRKGARATKPLKPIPLEAEAPPAEVPIEARTGRPQPPIDPPQLRIVEEHDQVEEPPAEVEDAGEGGGDGGLPLDGYSDELPSIEITPQRFRAVKASILALRVDPDLYVRNDSLVTVVQEAMDHLRISNRMEIRNIAGSPKIIALSDSNVGTTLTQVASFYSMKPDKYGEFRSVDVHPPDWLIKAVSTRKYWPGLRPLIAVAECPFPRPDGSIVDAKGYDEETRTLYLPSVKFPALPARPTRDDAVAAWERIKHYVREFPFASEEDRVVFLAGMLTVIARPAIIGPVPGIAVIGNKAGTGKGLLVDCMTMPGTGRNCPTSTYPDSKEEAVKVKVSIALAAKVAIHFDNLEEGSAYGSGPLDSMLTSTETDERQLGKNESPPLPIRSAFFLSGNNVYPCKDAYRRWLVLNLRTELDRPEERNDLEVEDLRGDVMANRGEIVRDALTILRSHAQAGRPKAQWPGFGSFNDWALVVRGAVWWATYHDCLATQRQASAEAPDRALKTALLAGIYQIPWARPGMAGITSQQIIDEAEKSTTPYLTLKAQLANRSRAGKPITGQQLGFVLRGLINQPNGGFKLTKHPKGDRHGNTVWFVECSDASFEGDEGHAEDVPGSPY